VSDDASEARRASPPAVTGQALRIALPSKGMEEDTLAFLRRSGMTVDRTNPRQYRARMRGLPSGPVEIVFQRATDIFGEVDQGTVDLGITGYDIVAEHRAEDDDVVIVHGELGYQRCALVLGIPESWVDVSSVSDLAEVATELRSTGRELRVATKYTNLTRQCLYDRGVTYFSLVEVSGAIEAAPSLDTADIICDLTSSGVTLRENRLKTIAGGTVLESQACLIGNRRILRHDPRRLEATCQVLELIEASLRSRQHLSLTANIRGKAAEDVARLVTASPDSAGLRGPTVARVYPKEPHTSSEMWFAVTVVVTEDRVLPAVEALRRAGASDVSAIPVTYVFEHRSWTFDALRRQLAGPSDGDQGEAGRWRSVRSPKITSHADAPGAADGDRQPANTREPGRGRAQP
jgi:ATP phosphoribosyltransferase